MSFSSHFDYAAGASGTVTVPAGRYVTGIACHATSAGTLTILAQGEETSAGTTGASIPLPAGVGLSLGAPVIRGDINELGPGSVFTFVGTDMYLLAYTRVR